MKKENNLIKLPKWCSVLVTLNNENKERLNMYKISRNLDLTYSHTRKIIIQMEILELLKQKKIGRRMEITLSKEGKEIQKRLIEIGKYLRKHQEG